MTKISVELVTRSKTNYLVRVSLNCHNLLSGIAFKAMNGKKYIWILSGKLTNFKRWSLCSNDSKIFL